MKRLLSLLLVAILLAPMTCAYADDTASDMRLEAYQGAVSVTDGNDKEVTVQNGMKLFDAYRVSTGADSCAWISLDQTKALKLSADGSARINKSGDKLEVELEKGELLVDVSAPLTSGEELNIRTSTTITSVRGTVFFVKVLNDDSTQVGVLDGNVSMTYTDPNTGNTQTVAIDAGQLGIAPPPAGAGASNPVGVQGLEAGVVGDFVLNEINGNPTLANRLRQSTSAVVRSLVPPADDAAVPAAAPPVYVYLELTGDSVTEEDILALEKALKEDQYLVVDLDGFHEISYDQPVVLGANQTINLTDSYLDLNKGLTNRGKLTVSDDSNLTVGTAVNTGAIVIDGTIDLGTLTNNSGVINVRGTLKITTSLNNESGVINVLDGGKLQIQGSGDSLVNYRENKGKIVIAADGELEIDEDVYLFNYGVIDNAGTITSNGDISNTGDGTITNAEEGTIDISGRFSNTTRAKLVNNGTINNKDSGNVNDELDAVGGATIENNGTIENSGKLSVGYAQDKSGTLNNNGTINNNAGGTFANDGGRIDNNGTITNDDEGIISIGVTFGAGDIGERPVTSQGSLTNEIDGTIDNNGKIENFGGSINNEGTITNNSGATIDNNKNYGGESTGTITNNGIINNSGTITGDGTITGNGTITWNSVVEVDP